jgi:hypothetical protein
MKSAFWRSIVVVALVAVPMMANANDATIGSETSFAAMQGGTLMNTTAIFNAFPHLAVNNGNGAELNVAPGYYDFDLDEDIESSAFGRLWWEAYDGTWLNFNVGRKDLGIQGTNFMWGGSSFMPVSYINIDEKFADGYDDVGVPGYFERIDRRAPFYNSQWVNLGVARPTSGGGAWAANVMFALGAETRKNDLTGGGARDIEDNQTGFGALLSWGNGDGLHLSGEFAWQKAEIKNNAATPASTDDFTVLDFGVNARYDTDAYIYQGNFVFLNSSASATAQESDPSGSTFGLLASAGRFIKNDVDGQATAEFGLAFLNDKQDEGTSTTEDSESIFVIPSMRTSVWQKISDRFGLMGGIQWAYRMVSEDDKTEVPGDPPSSSTEETTDNGSDFGWSVGLFFQPNDTVRIDAQLREDNLDHLLSLGNTNELITYIGATVALN